MTKFIRAQLIFNPSANEWHLHTRRGRSYFAQTRSEVIDAAQAGKQVLAIVEIKARFDEQNNIEWARKLEEAGVHVVYGLVGLKTHSKLSMVVRDDGDKLRRYVHIGTGNYHPKTARLYEDVGLLTTDPEVGEDVARLFNVLSGYSMNTDYDRFLVAPHSVRTGLVDRIEREITIEGDLDAVQREKLLEIADKCPVHRTLEGEVMFDERIELVG